MDGNGDLHYVDFHISIESSRSRLLNGGIAAMRYDVFVLLKRQHLVDNQLWLAGGSTGFLGTILRRNNDLLYFYLK